VPPIHRDRYLPATVRVPRLPPALRPGPFATAAWQVLGLVAANHVWTRGLAVFATTPPLEGPTPADLGALAVVSTIVWATLEELVFRGALFAWLRSRFDVPVAIFASAAAFAVLHAPALDAWVAFLIGLQLGALRQGRGLGLAVVAHVTSNLVFLAIGAVPEAVAIRHPAVFAVALAIAGSALAALVQEVRRSMR